MARYGRVSRNRGAFDKMATKKKIGTVHLHYYEYADGAWEIRVAVGKNDLPDPNKNMRGYVKMGLLTAQIAAYSKEQLLALDTLLVSSEEMKAVADRKKADVDRLQQKLPFEEEDNGKD